MKAPRIRTGKAKATNKPQRKPAKAKPTRKQIDAGNRAALAMARGA